MIIYYSLAVIDHLNPWLMDVNPTILLKIKFNIIKVKKPKSIDENKIWKSILLYFKS